MQFYGKAESAANRIVDLFRTPGKLPEALAPIFIRRKDALPCRAWSMSNQLLTAIAGTSDARGFRQWKEVGRNVKKGSRAFFILGPCHVKRTTTEDDGSESTKPILVGFRSIPVFRYEDTEGAELPDRTAADEFIGTLPLVDVARSWGLAVDTYNARPNGAQGWYMHGKEIAVGVKNVSTWAHELCHAADDRRGTLNRHKRGQDPDNEVVAELGGAILLTCLGQPVEADLGGAWSYVVNYQGKHAISACQKLLKRTCEAVALILETADTLSEAGKVAA